MTEALTRLRHANPVRSQDLAPSIEGVWDRLSDPALRGRPADAGRWFPTGRHRRALRRLAVIAAGSVALLLAVLVFGTAGSGPPSAFAGWTAIPTAPSSGETAGALERCTSALASAGGPGSGIPPAGWKPLLTDTRGPFTAIVLESGGASATCLNGPSFTSTAANATQSGGASQHTLSIGVTGRATPSSVSVMGLAGAGSGLISTSSQVQTSTRGGQPYTLVQGQVARGVSRVTLVRSDGRNVQATVEDGTFIAWWPGSATASSARLTTASGVTTQQLTFAPLPKPNAPPANAGRSARSSR